MVGIGDPERFQRKIQQQVEELSGRR